MSDQISLLDGDRFAPGADLLDVDSCQRKWMVEPGEVFTFDGRTAGHVLICGDARSRAVADLAVRLVGRTRRRIAIIDPPYGIKYRSGWRGRLSDTGKPLVSRRVDADFGADEFDTSWMPTWKAAADPKAVYLFSGWTISARWREAMTAAGWPPKARIIWDKMHYGMGDLESYGDQTEDVFFWSDLKPSWPKRQGNLWQEPRGVCLEGGQVGHPTPKPFGLYRRPIQHMTEPGDVVLDMFAGSGPALIVADGLGRRAALVETSPRYCALILERAERRKINLITRSKDPTCVHSSPAP
jgi:DNA modification methylase